MKRYSMRRLSSQFRTCLVVVLLGAAASHQVVAEEYYRWKDSEGVMHYGTRPPAGVEAEIINTWGESAGESQPQQETENAGKSPASEQQKEVIAARKKQCQEERDRLNALKTSGHRIQMQQEDGSVKYLTPEEIAREVEQSENYVNQACKDH